MLSDCEYTHYDTSAGEWWGMPRNQWGIEIAPAPRSRDKEYCLCGAEYPDCRCRNRYGFESIFADPENQRQAAGALGITDPKIPYLLWPIAIVGALLFAHAVNGMCRK